MSAFANPFFSFTKRPNLAVDLGNRNTVFWSDKNDQFFSSATAIAFKTERTGRRSLLAVGQPALELEGRTNSNVDFIQPLKGGMVTDIDSAAQMLTGLLLEKGPNRSSYFSEILISLPTTATDIERKAFTDVIKHLNARRIFTICEPLAAALGAGVDVLRPYGRCIVDVGDGIVEAALISMGEIVTSYSLRLENRSFEACLITYLREESNFHISRREAEKVKLSLSQNSEPHSIHLQGFCSHKNLPAARTFPSEDFNFIRERFCADVVACILTLLEQLQPEISTDLSTSGILLTGGNSLDPILQTELEKALKIKILLAPDPLLSVAMGNKRALQEKQFRQLLRRFS